ncbi:MAG TPA: DUF2059 domain-containing protein [Caulobacteraceae bacterium]|nr:DUF2059 domain-containing protein [Caulobacteraceae bacterium]
MRLSSLIAAALAAAALAASAEAQTLSSPPQSDPDAATRMQLARQLLDLSGGTEAVNAQMRSMFAMTTNLVAANVPPEQAKFVAAIERDMQDEVMQMIPSLLDATVQAYADNLTAEQLQDYIAWLSSDTGRALVAKTPLIKLEVMQREAPLMSAMIPALQHKVADRVCEELHCTPHEREVVANAMAKALAPKS